MKQNIDSNLIFKGGSLIDWEIFFEDRSKDAPKFINDINGMTGCLNFLDMTVKNLKLNASGSKCEDSINFIRVNGSLDNLYISESKSDGFDADFSKLKINNIKIFDSGNDCIDFSYGEYELINVKLSGCGDKGVSIGEKSTVKLKKLIAENTNVGVATKDYGTFFAENLELDNVEYCITAYSKKQEFSGGKADIKKINCSNFNNSFKSDKTSMIKIEENLSKKKNITKVYEDFQMSFRVEEKCILKNIDKNKFKSTLFKIGGKILFPKREIMSLYFDTKATKMFFDSEEGTTPRKKIRVRTYPNEKHKTFNLEKKINSAEGRYKISEKINIEKYIKILKQGIIDNEYGFFILKFG